MKPLCSVPTSPKKVYWNDEGTIAAFLLPEKLVMLEYDPSKNNFSNSFTIVDKINSGVFIYNLFFYISTSGKIHYTAKGKSFLYCNADRRQMIIGAIEGQNRLYTFDKNFSVFCYEVPYGLAAMISKVADGKAVEVEPEDILPEYRDRIARFLDSFEMKEKAFEVVLNNDHKFELAISLGLIREGKASY